MILSLKGYQNCIIGSKVMVLRFSFSLILLMDWKKNISFLFVICRSLLMLMSILYTLTKSLTCIVHPMPLPYDQHIKKIYIFILCNTFYVLHQYLKGFLLILWLESVIKYLQYLRQQHCTAWWVMKAKKIKENNFIFSRLVCNNFCLSFSLCPDPLQSLFEVSN